MCALGYNVMNYWYKVNFALDLLHHIFHIIVLAEGVVKHYGDPWGRRSGICEEREWRPR